MYAETIALTCQQSPTLLEFPVAEKEPFPATNYRAVRPVFTGIGILGLWHKIGSK